MSRHKGVGSSLAALPPQNQVHWLRRFAARPVVAPLVFAGVVCSLAAVWQLNQLGAQLRRNQALEEEVERLDAQIKSIEVIKAEVEAISRQIRDSAGRKALPQWPLRLLDAIAASAGERVVIDEVRETQAGFDIHGQASSFESVAGVVRALTYDSPVVAGSPHVEAARNDVRAGSAPDWPARFTVTAPVKDGARAKQDGVLVPSRLREGTRDPP